ncbi:ATP-dependent sacrificial sulfur transferase LarE [Haloimpatiens lingqiaonensis]|uniref:ATP-dependent sacrificial sulfur transferase LarE n=1 Tax=Haloimpatiens lingqiaonensis TaxID=1380675 RepID=UPI0010FD2B0D|nr:ATP-dependent sacrificial sulfur transferase LarE [Haloimpatiens lingqiaonensis]
MENSLQEKYLKLLEYIKTLDSCVVAFSGGVDSTFLLKACIDALGDNVLAVTIDTPYIPRWEIKEGKDFAKKLKVKHKFINIPIMDEIKNNPIDRCYLCKKQVFSAIKKLASEEGYKHVVDGTNYDDTKDYRPGMKALKELGIKSPLMYMEFNKRHIRDLSKELGLSTWKKPAYACLLSRIPYESYIKIEDLKKIEKSEKYLMNIGFKAVRVRCHGDLARIEVDKNDFKNILEEELLDVIGDKLKEYGFKYVTLDVKGYRMSGLELKK